MRVDHLAGLLLVDLVAVLGYRVLRIVDTCLRNARLEAVLRVFGQVGQLNTGFAFEPVKLESERLAGQAAPDGDIALVGTQVVRAGDTRVGPDASCQHKDEGQDGGDSNVAATHALRLAHNAIVNQVNDYYGHVVVAAGGKRRVH